MGGSGQATTIELGMKVSVRRSGQNRIGVVTRVTGDYVGIRWTNSDFGETAEYQAHSPVSKLSSPRNRPRP